MLKRPAVLHEDTLERLPVNSQDLVRELDRAFPPRCIRQGESEIDAHRYAAKRELVDWLITRLNSAPDSDPSRPLLG